MINDSDSKRIEKLLNSAKVYLASNYIDPIKTNNIHKKGFSQVQFSIGSQDNYDKNSIKSVLQKSLNDDPYKVLKEIEKSTNMSFVDKMLDYIDSRNLRDSEIYKAAQIDRRLFSKIVSDRSYKPAKDTCIALCLAMKLPLEEANDLLSRAGYTFSHSNKRDVILEFFFQEKVYNLMDVNEVLSVLGQKMLGR